ncbi:MAG TPA: hypothetical protein VK763_03865 [Terriglobales bacterium]|jgi:hypothetical protein|nr:hypothetical protein [Terriglobales bacterium]
MSTTTQSTRTPVSKETGLLNRKWRSILFFIEKRAFESKLEGILRAAAGHEGNSLPAGDQQYHLLSSEAGSLCTEFANRWGLDIELLKARIAGLTKLERLSVPPPTKNYAGLACLGMFAIPVLCFLVGAVAGFVSLGFHLVGGR